MQIKDMTIEQIKDALIRGQQYLLNVAQVQNEVNILQNELNIRAEASKIITKKNDKKS